MDTLEKLETLPLESIRFDGDTQCRIEVDSDYEKELQSLFNDDNPIWPRELPPIHACRDDAGEIWIWDGFYRGMAARGAGCRYVPVMVRVGTVEDAQWLSCGANKAHGLRREKGDIARAIRKAIELKPTILQKDVARHIGCSLKHVSLNDPRYRMHDKKTHKDGGKSLPGNVSGQSESSIKLPDWPNDEDSEEMEADGVGEEAPQAEDGAGREGESESLSASTEKGDAVDESPAHPSQDAEGPAASPPKDLLGVALPTRAAVEIFRDLSLIEDMKHHLAQLESAIERYCNRPISAPARERWLRYQEHTYSGVKHTRWFAEELDTVRKRIDYFSPYSGTCPECGPIPKPMCNVCDGQPFVLESAWDAWQERERIWRLAEQ